jgi:hypothetical protein
MEIGVFENFRRALAVSEMEYMDLHAAICRADRRARAAMRIGSNADCA